MLIGNLIIDVGLTKIENFGLPRLEVDVIGCDIQGP